MSINVQQYATNYTQFILSVNCCTCFGWFLHPSSGAQINVCTASGISSRCCYVSLSWNLTKIKFTKEEITLLNNGWQHSIEKSLNTYWINLIMETERAIKLLDANVHNTFRILAAKKLKQTNLQLGQQLQRHTETAGIYFKEHKSQACNGKCNNSQSR